MKIKKKFKSFTSIILIVSMILISSSNTGAVTTSKTSNFISAEKISSNSSNPGITESDSTNRIIDNKETVVADVYKTNTVKNPSNLNNSNAKTTQTVYQSVYNVLDSRNNIKTNRYIIKYKDNVDKKAFLGSLVSDVSKSREISSKRTKNLHLLDLKQEITPNEMLSKLKDCKLESQIEYIQPDYKVRLSSDDTSYGLQWGFYNKLPVELIGDSTQSKEQNTVQSSVYNTKRIDVNISDTWEQYQGEGVIVAVIDTGVDINHEDLKNNIWVNTKEIPDNGIDDDSNGFIDDVNGWDFYNNTNQVNPISLSEEWHGTHVCGVIAAEKDNKIGIAGVAPKAKILPLKVFQDGQAFTSDIIESIEYAEKMGAKIVNCSFGSGDENLALKETIEKSSMLFVCSAGNSGKDNDIYPTYPASIQSSNVISVAAINHYGSLTNFSNYGKNSVNVTAPGEYIISTMPGNKYARKSGSSMSAAFVSAEAALLIGKNSNLASSEIKKRILNSSDKLSSLIGKIADSNKINIKDSFTVPLYDKSKVWNIQDSSNLTNQTVFQEVYDKGYTLTATEKSIFMFEDCNRTGGYPTMLSDTISIPGATSIRVFFSNISYVNDPIYTYGMSYVRTSAGDVINPQNYVCSSWAQGSSITIYYEGSTVSTITGIDYTINVLDDYGDTIDTAETKQVGTSFTGKIDYQDDVDCFKLIPSSSGYLTIYSCNAPNYDMYGELYDSSGSWLVSNNDINTYDSNFKMCIPVEAGQVYYLMVYDYWSTPLPDPYLIKVDFTSNTSTNISAASTISTFQNQTFNFVFNASNIQSFTGKTLSLSYNTSELEVVDLCAYTYKQELAIGKVLGTDITITEISEGRIVFTVDRTIPSEKVWSGIVNIIKFRAKVNGNSSVTYSIQ